MRLGSKVNSLHHQLPCLIAMHDLRSLGSSVRLINSHVVAKVTLVAYGDD